MFRFLQQKKDPFYDRIINRCHYGVDHYFIAYFKDFDPLLFGLFWERTFKRLCRYCIVFFGEKINFYFVLCKHHLL